jgi:hypothetical protein
LLQEKCTVYFNNDSEILNFTTRINVTKNTTKELVNEKYLIKLSCLPGVNNKIKIQPNRNIIKEITGIELICKNHETNEIQKLN